ncbi:YibE/F family protein [Salinifilum ghardaiensis]
MPERDPSGPPRPPTPHPFAAHRDAAHPDAGAPADSPAEHSPAEHSAAEHAAATHAPAAHSAAPNVGHGHGHGTAAPASPRVRAVLTAVLGPVLLVALIGVLVLHPFGEHPRSGADLGFGASPVHGEVIAAESGSCTLSSTGGPDSSAGDCTRLRVTMSDGPAGGETIEQVMPIGPGTPHFGAGDRVVLSYSGAEPSSDGSYQVVDFQRDHGLLALVGLFAAAVLVLARWKGLRSLLGIGVSFAVLIGFALPAILAGRDPLLVALVASGVIMFAVLYLAHGLSARTSTAVLGTIASLGLIGLLSAVFSGATRLTGLDEETTQLVGALNAPIDARGLLLAGIVIGALGVLDDVTVTQTSAVWELHEANPRLSWRELYRAALRIGRDHVASSVNTLVLAYAGAALPLLLAYSLSGSGFRTIATSQDVAQEAVRTLVGSIGIIAAVPITTALAAAVVSSGSAAGAHRPHPAVLTARAGAIAAARSATAQTPRPPRAPPR